jgi:hypothetical protein
MNGIRFAGKFIFTKNKPFVFRYDLLICFNELSEEAGNR